MVTKSQYLQKVRSAMLVLSTLCASSILIAQDPDLENITLPKLDGEKLSQVDRSMWNLPDFNPTAEEVKTGLFYYGLQIDGKLFFSPVHEGGEAEIGQRAGGHFKIIREAYRISALLEGRSAAEAELVMQKAQRLQSKFKLPVTNVVPFGIKIVEIPGIGKALKWHGFNSFKSTLKSNLTPVGDKPKIPYEDVIIPVADRLKLPSVVADPINDVDLLLNPKYLDKTQTKYYRGEQRLQDLTQLTLAGVKKANAKLGYKNINAEIALPAPKTTVCGWLNAAFNAMKEGFF